jgi:hypothetical protein
MERKSFAESAMVNDPASKIFKANNQVAGSLSYACKFAYAGGQSGSNTLNIEVERFVVHHQLQVQHFH